MPVKYTVSDLKDAAVQAFDYMDDHMDVVDERKSYAIFDCLLQGILSRKEKRIPENYKVVKSLTDLCADETM